MTINGSYEEGEKRMEGDVKRWYAPGHDGGEDRLLMVWPAAGWFLGDRGYAAPGYLVTHPGCDSSGYGSSIAYYVSDGDRWRLAWSARYRSLRLEPLYRSIVAEVPESQFKSVSVVQLMDNVSGVHRGVQVDDWVPPTDREPRYAAPEVEATIHQMERIRATRLAEREVQLQRRHP